MANQLGRPNGSDARTGLLSLLNPVRVAAQAKRSVERRSYGDTFWNLYSKLDLFVPNVLGPRQDVARLTFQAAEQVFPLLGAIVDEVGADRSPMLDAEAFCVGDAEREAARRLRALFDDHGSDKANSHNYHFVYGALLARTRPVETLLEIGLGTNYEDAVSNMGATGRPGASLRAFRDYLTEALIYGADVDRRILFQEERIRTFFVDQTDVGSFAELEALGGFDLIIDDGLHSPSANLAVLLFGLRAIKVGGWIVIEDIPARALPVWQVVGAILPQSYRTNIIKGDVAFMFLVERRA